MAAPQSPTKAKRRARWAPTPLLAVRKVKAALCGAMLSLITPGQLGIKVYCKQNARLKNSLNPAFYFFAVEFKSLTTQYLY